jgi:hypothetical protein
MGKDKFDIIDDIIAISILFIMITPIVLLVMLAIRAFFWLTININI